MGAGHGRQRDEIDDIADHLEKHLFVGYKPALELDDKRRQELFNHLPDNVVNKIIAERFRKDVSAKDTEKRNEMMTEVERLQATRNSRVNRFLEDNGIEPIPHRQIDRGITEAIQTYAERKRLYNKMLAPLKQMGY